MKKVFDIAFESMKAREWSKIYVLVDVHGVLCPPDYKTYTTEIYPECIEPMQRMSKDARFCLIMWTCSSPEHIEKYRKMFEEHDIHFQFANENPEVTKTNGYGDFSRKLYGNCVLEDKAGFEPARDWPLINEWLDENFIGNIPF